jgi:hypothetical protein
MIIKTTLNTYYIHNSGQMYTPDAKKHANECEKCETKDKNSAGYVQQGERKKYIKTLHNPNISTIF